MKNFKEYVFDRHDNYCNQKYGNYNLPYSFHLECVLQQSLLFKDLLKDDEDRVVYFAALLHDGIEDARLTYNDIVEVVTEYVNKGFAVRVADIIYAVTDEKGKNRAERKNDKYYKELSENKLAVFVKLSDIAANTLYSKLTGSSMYKKYKSEFGGFKEKCFIEEYSPFFDYVEGL